VRLGPLGVRARREPVLVARAVERRARLALELGVGHVGEGRRGLYPDRAHRVPQQPHRGPHPLAGGQRRDGARGSEPHERVGVAGGGFERRQRLRPDVRWQQRDRGAAHDPRRARVAHDREQLRLGPRAVVAPRVEGRRVVRFAVASAG
jgi:hypothetical protein